MQNFHKQKGLSSVEMVMILPFFLVFLIMLANIGRFWHMKMDNQVNARTEAWREAMFGSLPDVLCESIEERADLLREQEKRLALLYGYEPIRNAVNWALSPAGNSLACQGNLKNNQDYRHTTVLATAGGQHGLSSKIRGYRGGLLGEFYKTADQPYAVTGRAYYLWADWNLGDKDVLFFEDYHVLDVNGTYQRVDLPYGHDDYIKRFLINR